MMISLFGRVENIMGKRENAESRKSVRKGEITPSNFSFSHSVVKRC